MCPELPLRERSPLGRALYCSLGLTPEGAGEALDHALSIQDHTWQDLKSVYDTADPEVEDRPTVFHKNAKANPSGAFARYPGNPLVKLIVEGLAAAGSCCIMWGSSSADAVPPRFCALCELALTCTDCSDLHRRW